MTLCVCSAASEVCIQHESLDSSEPPCGAKDDITPAFWYSPTLFSKKFVLPCKEISSIQSKGLEAPYSLEWPKAAKRRSATNSMYRVISSLFMPIRSHESASQMKRRSTSTAAPMMSCTTSSGNLCCSMP